MSTIGQSIDRMYDLEVKIDAAEAKVKELKQQRSELESRLLRKFGSEKIDGCKGVRGTASVRIAKFLSIKDRRKFERYVIKHRAFDLFQSRVSSRAYFDRLEDGEPVPGVRVFERTGVSIRRRKS